MKTLMVHGRLYVRYGERDIRCIDNTRHRLVVKAKRDPDVLPQTHGALEFHSQGVTIKLRYGFKQTM